MIDSHNKALKGNNILSRLTCDTREGGALVCTSDSFVDSGSVHLSIRIYIYI